MHDRAIARSSAGLRSDGRHQQAKLEHWQQQGDGHGATWKLPHGGREETIRTYHDPLREGEDLSSRTYREVRAMADWLRSAGVPMILIRYPVRIWPMKGPTEAMERLASERGIPILDTTAAIERIPEHERVWHPALHPSAPMYEQIASRLLPLVLDLTP